MNFSNKSDSLHSDWDILFVNVSANLVADCSNPQLSSVQ